MDLAFVKAMQVLLCFIGIKLPVSFSVLSRGYFFMPPENRAEIASIGKAHLPAYLRHGDIRKFKQTLCLA